MILRVWWACSKDSVTIELAPKCYGHAFGTLLCMGPNPYSGSWPGYEGVWGWGGIPSKMKKVQKIDFCNVVLFWSYGSYGVPRHVLRRLPTSIAPLDHLNHARALAHPRSLWKKWKSWNWKNINKNKIKIKNRKKVEKSKNRKKLKITKKFY